MIFLGSANAEFENWVSELVEVKVSELYLKDRMTHSATRLLPRGALNTPKMFYILGAQIKEHIPQTNAAKPWD